MVLGLSRAWNFPIAIIISTLCMLFLFWNCFDIVSSTSKSYNKNNHNNIGNAFNFSNITISVRPYYQNSSIFMDKKILIDNLTRDLKRKLEGILPSDAMKLPKTCVNETSIERSCSKEGCLRLTLPKTLRSRIQQLVYPSHMTPSLKYQNVLEEMRDSVPGNYEYIFVTAASNNHYLESKAHLANLHQNVFPYLTNFTFIYYDLGLTSEQESDIKKICRCHYREFPFTKFPQIFSNLRCYGWKPMIVYAHAPRSDVIYWMDASVRFTNDSSKLKDHLQMVKERGIQSGTNSLRIPRVTLPSMFHFFGDEACAYHPFTEITAGRVAFHNEPLIREAVIAPWASCALNETCICPYKEVGLTEALLWNGNKFLKDEFAYGLCHRFDQSALGITVRKLFQDKSHHLLRREIKSVADIRRGDMWPEKDKGFIF